VQIQGGTTRCRKIALIQPQVSKGGKPDKVFRRAVDFPRGSAGKNAAFIDRLVKMRCLPAGRCPLLVLDPPRERWSAQKKPLE
jgi:hypothetical protein